MPHKANERRRHKIPRARHRVTNRPEYDGALQQRGGLTVWVTPEALAAWHPPGTGRPEGPLAHVLGPGHRSGPPAAPHLRPPVAADRRSEEHTSELQSRQYLVCRLLLEKKTNDINHHVSQ